MKICVLNSYTKDSSCEYFSDPANFITDNKYEFIVKVLTSGNELEKVKEGVNEGCDYFWSFLTEHSKGEIEALEYLEQLEIPMIGGSSASIAINKLASKKYLSSINKSFHVPNWTLGSKLNLSEISFPVIVKSIDRKVLDIENVICQNSEELNEEILICQFKGESMLEQILVEEFIVGDKASCIVVETLDGLIAMTPIFHHGVKAEEELDWNSYIVENHSKKSNDYIMKKIQELSIQAFIVHRIAGNGYGQVDFQVRGDHVYITKFNPSPSFFIKSDELNSSDPNENVDIEEIYPGGYLGFLDTIIQAKESGNNVKKFYDKFCGEYEKRLGETGTGIKTIWLNFVNHKDYELEGKILDLGCGTGLIGRLIQSKYPNSTLVGIDICKKMTAFATNYDQILVGPVENMIYETDGKEKFDHTISCGMFQFLDPPTFLQVLGKCFELSSTSIVITIEEVTENYVKMMKDAGYKTMHNHISTIKKLQVPKDWKLKYTTRQSLFLSPQIGEEVFGTLFVYLKNPME